jgi:hypothetical protein
MSGEVMPDYEDAIWSLIHPGVGAVARKRLADRYYADPNQRTT